MSKRKFSNGTFYTAKQKESMYDCGKILMIPLMIVFAPVFIIMAFANMFVDFGPFRLFK